MTRAKAKEIQSAMKKASARLEAEGVTPYKHRSSDDAAEGVDSNDDGVVNSVPDAAMAGIVNQLTTRTNMTDPVKTPKLTAEEREAAKAEATAKAKAEKEAAKAAAKAEKEAAKAAKAEAAAKAKAEKAAALEAARKAAAESTTEGDESGRKRTYFGTMMTLAERVKTGAYVKGTNGQLRCNDDVAVAFDAVSPLGVIRTIREVLGFIDVNPYGHLNIGQQSMNLRNKLRGALKAGVEINGNKVTIEYVNAVRDRVIEEIDNEVAALAKVAAEANQTAAQAVTKTE